MGKFDTMLTLMKDNPRGIFLALGRNGLLNWISDKAYLKMVFACETKQKLDLENPITFNQKLQWLKLYNRRKEYTIYADKFAVREYVKERIGEKYLIPLLGTYDSVEEIPWVDLPEQFVIKCTHGSGCNIICLDKCNLDTELAKSKLQRWMKYNYYWPAREWPYKNVVPRIICEKFLAGYNNEEIKDYKIYCFDGDPKLIHVDIDKYGNHRRNIYDTDWNFLDATIQYPNDRSLIEARPKQLGTLLELCRNLSQSIPHVRVDFFIVDEKIYFGEMTFFNGAGFENFNPKSLEIEMGDWINLSKVS